MKLPKGYKKPKATKQTSLSSYFSTGATPKKKDTPAPTTTTTTSAEAKRKATATAKPSSNDDVISLVDDYKAPTPTPPKPSPTPTTTTTTAAAVATPPTHTDTDVDMTGGESAADSPLSSVASTIASSPFTPGVEASSNGSTRHPRAAKAKRRIIIESDDEDDDEQVVVKKKVLTKRKKKVVEDDSDYEDKGASSSSDSDSASSSVTHKRKRSDSNDDDVSGSPAKMPRVAEGEETELDKVEIGGDVEMTDVPVFERDEKRHSKFKKTLMRVTEAREERKAAQENWIKATSSSKYTPLEQQVADLKQQHPGVLLAVEVGYKYRFFGDDAEIASKVCRIVAFHDRHFLCAGIPTHRLRHHVLKLVNAGYKVGVVTQTESAALKKAGDNKAGPFTRQLTALYTQSTLVGEEMDPLLSTNERDSQEEGDNTSSAVSGVLMCMYEKPTQAKAPSLSEDDHVDEIELSFAAVHPSTGHVIYDTFSDGLGRERLTTVLRHLSPVELLLPEHLSVHTRNVVGVLGGSGRVERRENEQFDSEDAVESVTEFFKSVNTPHAVESVLSLPPGVLGCLHVLCAYLREFQLESILTLTPNFAQFSSIEQMQLNGATLANLEVVANAETGDSKNSLVWMMDFTATQFGRRLFRKWVTGPLLSAQQISERQEAVGELMTSSERLVSTLKTTLASLPDLDRGLLRVHCKRCSPKELVTVLTAFIRAASAIPSADVINTTFTSDLLRSLLGSLPNVGSVLSGLLGCLSAKAANENDKSALFTDPSMFPEVEEWKTAVKGTHDKLHEELVSARNTLGMPKLEFKTVLVNTHLIDVPAGKMKKVPASWVQVNSTKKTTRYHTPRVLELLNELAINEEHLRQRAETAWDTFLGRVGECYGDLSALARAFAELDCLFSLATLSARGGYVRPRVLEGSDEQVLSIVDGRHPVVETMSDGSYVPNSVDMRGNGERVLIITGPNMGGKSSFIRQTALLLVMAQVGAWVPATSMEFTPFDAVYTRMGASDDISKGQSTFFVELIEASDILHKATPRSLVILDELGRGTSTHDGVAIAHATLEYVVNTLRCPTLFVTHYPALGALEGSYTGTVANYHMAFMDDPDAQEGVSSIIFLYKLKKGMASRSYGLNVARLANLPESILSLAATKSKELEAQIASREAPLPSGLFVDAYKSVCSVVEGKGGEGEKGRLRELCAGVSA